MDVLKTNGHKTYIVGGCVRDSILKREINDWDICTSAKPQAVFELFKYQQGFKVLPIGIEHGTVVVLHRGNSYEITTFRIDGEYIDCRRPSSVSFAQKIEEDLSRRDFTVNAIAYNHEDGIVDPFGGIEDIKNSVIRCVGDPDERFAEDALRMFRAVRFASELGFEIEKATLDAIFKNHRLGGRISVERIRQEFNRTIMSDSPSRGIRLFVDTGLMKFIAEEIYTIIGFDQMNPYHDKDVFEHTMKVLDNTPKRLKLRIAALFHDISKPECMFIGSNGIGHFYDHDIEGSDAAMNILRRLKYDNGTINSVGILIREHMINLEHFTDKGIKRFIKRIGMENIQDFLDLRRADISGCRGPFDYGPLDRFAARVEGVIRRQEPMNIRDLEIGGEDLMEIGYRQGTQIGETLRYLLEEVLEDPNVNKKDVLIEMAAERLKNR